MVVKVGRRVQSIRLFPTATPANEPRIGVAGVCCGTLVLVDLANKPKYSVLRAPLAAALHLEGVGDVFPWPRPDQ